MKRVVGVKDAALKRGYLRRAVPRWRFPGNCFRAGDPSVVMYYCVADQDSYLVSGTPGDCVACAASTRASCGRSSVFTQFPELS